MMCVLLNETHLNMLKKVRNVILLGGVFKIIWSNETLMDTSSWATQTQLEGCDVLCAGCLNSKHC